MDDQRRLHSLRSESDDAVNGNHPMRHEMVASESMLYHRSCEGIGSIGNKSGVQESALGTAAAYCASKARVSFWFGATSPNLTKPPKPSMRPPACKPELLSGPKSETHDS